MPLLLILTAIVTVAVSGLPALFGTRTSNTTQILSCVTIVIGACAGLMGAVLTLWSGEVHTASVFWWAIGWCDIGVDALSALFLLPIFSVGGLGSLYGLGYWPKKKHPVNFRKLQIFWGFIVAGMALLVISRHAILFLLGWEIMALSAFFLVATQDTHKETRRAAWIYLIATHVSTLMLFFLFSLWKLITGSYILQPLCSPVNSYLMHTLFLISLIGFGIKAGIMPFHFWLPSAHAAAPGHVSALMSGVVIKMGIYGMVRWLTLLPDPPLAWGKILFVLGMVSGLGGVLFAMAQHDMKRLLAYHSVENIGIMLMGLGIAMIGKSTEQPLLVFLGMAGCLLHMWNHSLFKPLLFLCAGVVTHHTFTRQIDRLGGLARTMPVTAMLFLAGAVAISGLPPLNGFISELFIYLGMVDTLAGTIDTLLVPLGIPVLALIGALAAACFVKVFGVVFLGTARTDLVKTDEAPLTMLLPMGALAVLCFLIGMVPSLFRGCLVNAVSVWDASVLQNEIPGHAGGAPLTTIGILNAGMVILSIIAYLTIVSRKRNTAMYGTWDCGYAAPDRRMQYTASSFIHSITAYFNWLLKPHQHQPRLNTLFPGPGEKMESHVNEIVLDRVLLPASRQFKRCSGWFHRFQQGSIQQYILYILVIVILLMCTRMPFILIIREWAGR